MLRSAITIWIVLFLSALAQSADDAPTAIRPAVVVVSQAIANGGPSGCCSGVCVTADGLVMTAKHCGEKPIVSVWFPTLGSRSAKLIYTSDEAEGPLVYRVERRDDERLPFLRVSQQKPKTGEPVTAAGYPFCERQQYTEHVGEVTGGLDGSHGGEYSGVAFNVTNRPSVMGMSGGPLVNASGEVVGLCHGTDFVSSFWISWTATSAAMKACQSQERAPPKEEATQRIVFCVEKCAPCESLERDIAAGRLGRVVIVRRTREGWDQPALVAECEQTTGERMKTFPVAWVRGAKVCRSGYTTTGRDGLLQWFVNVGQSVGQIFVGRPDAPPADPRWKPSPPKPGPGLGPSVEPPASEAAPVPIETPPDWSTVSIVVLAARQEVGLVRGAARGLALKKARGLVERRINEQLDGRAQLDLIDERTQPNRYRAICEAARIEPDPVSVIVLVRQLPIGLKGLIAGKVEKILAGTIPEGIPIDLIFERAHTTDFANVIRGLLMPDGAMPYQRETPGMMPSPDPISTPPQADTPSPFKAESGAAKPSAPATTIDGAVDDRIAERVGEVLDEKLAQHDSAESDDAEKRSWPARIIAFVLAMLGASHATGGVRAFLAAKAREALARKLKES